MTQTDAAGERSVEVVERFFAALEALDVDSFVELWAEDGVQEMPFAPKNFPNRLVGKADVRRQYGGMPEAYARMEFPGRRVRAMADPEWVVAEYRGEIDLEGGGSYNNDYVGIFRVVDGRITLFKEYFNPQILLDSFGGEEGLARTFSLPTSALPTSCRKETTLTGQCGRWEASTNTV